MLEFTKYNVPERNCLQSVTDRLSEIRSDKEVILIAFCSKLALYSDPMDVSPVFVYKFGDKNANEIVLSWAEAISKINYCLPSLKVKFMIATMNMEELALIIEVPERLKDPDLKAAILKHKDVLVEENKE